MTCHDVTECLITVCPVNATVSYTYTILCVCFFFLIVTVNNIWRRMLLISCIHLSTLSLFVCHSISCYFTTQYSLITTTDHPLFYDCALSSHSMSFFASFPSGSRNLSDSIFRVTCLSIHRRYGATLLLKNACCFAVKHLSDSWVKRAQLDVTCFIISLFNAQHFFGC